MDYTKTIKDAIPIEWMEYRIKHADKEGFKDAATTFRWVLWCWQNQKEEWEKNKQK